MKVHPKLMMATCNGVLTGASLVFLAVVAAVGFAYVTATAVHSPGIIQAWFTTENGMPALNFEPNFAGMLVGVGVVAAAYCVLIWRRSRNSSSNDLRLHF